MAFSQKLLQASITMANGVFSGGQNSATITGAGDGTSGTAGVGKSTQAVVGLRMSATTSGYRLLANQLRRTSERT
jgi:hypothetical protein